MSLIASMQEDLVTPKEAAQIMSERAGYQITTDDLKQLRRSGKVKVARQLARTTLYERSEIERAPLPRKHRLKQLEPESKMADPDANIKDEAQSLISERRQILQVEAQKLDLEKQRLALEERRLVLEERRVALEEKRLALLESQDANIHTKMLHWSLD